MGLSLSIVEMVTILSLLLLLANLVLFVSKKVKLPYAILLFIIGLIAGNVRFFPQVESLGITKDLLFFIFLPPLLYESAFNINFRRFQKDFGVITMLASVGVILSSFVVGFLASTILGIPIFVALIFAAIISSTDPIAVISIFKELGLKKRLIQMIDSESMFNDGTSAIFLDIILTFGTIGLAAGTLWEGIGGFVYVVVGGISVGILSGFLASAIIGQIKNDFLIEVTMTIVTAYLSFIIAEEVFDVSGIVSTVVTGIMVGNYGRDSFSPQVKLILKDLWEYIAFIANSFVFLLIGISLKLDIVLDHLDKILILYLIVIFSRAVSVYLIGFLHNQFSTKDKFIPNSWLHILNWGGLRGALPVALALGLTSEIGENPFLNAESIEIIYINTIGVVLLSLLVNGLTLKPLIRFLKVNRATTKDSIELLLMKGYVLNRGIRRIKNLEKIGHITDQNRNLMRKFEGSFKKVIKQVKKTFEESPRDVEAVLYQHAFNIEKHVFIRLYEKHTITKKILNVLEEKILEGMDLIESGIFPEDFYLYSKKMLALSQKNNKGFNLQEKYLFRKAREYGNLEVLEELEVFENIPSLRPCIQKVTNAYYRFHTKNHNLCVQMEEDNPKVIEEFKRDIYFAEFVATEEDVIDRLHHEGKISMTTVNELRSILVGGF